MAKPAERARNFIQSKVPGAIVSSRHRGKIVMSDPSTPGRFIEYSLLGNRGMHYGQNYDLEIDTTWVSNGPGWVMNDAEYNATLQSAHLNFFLAS